MFTKNEKLLLFTIAAIQFAHIVDFMIMMPLGPQLIRIFQITPKEFSLLVASYTLFGGLSGFLASFFMDRFERKKLLYFFFIGFAISTIGCALSPTYSILILARSLAGTFGGVLNSITMSIVTDHFAYEKRGTAMGWTSTSFSMASILGVPFSIYLANHFNWHAPFMFLGGLSLFLLIGIYYLIPLNPIKGELSSNYFKPLIEILKTKNLVLGLLFMVLLFLGHFTLIPFFSPSLVANAGLDEKDLPFIYLCGGLASIICAPIIGRLSDRFGKHKIFFYGVLSSLIPIFIVTNLGHTPIYLILVLTSLFFITMGSRMIPAMALISSAPSADKRGTYMGLVSSVQALGSALASSVAGMIIIKNESTGELMNYQYVGYIAIGFSFLALLVARKVQHSTH